MMTKVSPKWGLPEQISLFFFFFLILMEVYLISSAVLISGVQQSDSVIHMHVLFHSLA